MASPQNDMGADGDSKNNLEQITFRFCSECSNMLYPKEDEDSHKLQFTCRTCQYTEEATSTCVFRNLMNNAAGETAGVTQDVGSDPTVGSVVFSSDASAAPHPELGAEIAVCLRCGNPLLHCKVCGDPASVVAYNKAVLSDSDFMASRCFNYARLAGYFNALDSEARDAWDANFAICHGPRIPNLSQDCISHYLPMEYAMDPEADPPEALGVERDESQDESEYLEIS